MFKKILLGLLGALLLLTAVLVFNTLQFKSKQLAIDAEPAPELSGVALRHFQTAIHYRTISFGDTARLDTTQFFGFHRFLTTTYPRVHTTMKRERVGGYSLLYTWEGKNLSLPPIVLMAHQDVVPVEEETRKMWTVDPFEGVVKEDYIWGRGTTDDKINLISIMESAEKLLEENFQPERTIYLAFGHDEEMGGKGAQAIAALLQSRGIKAELVLDEGGIVTKDKVPGMTKQIALIGTSEKGYLSLELSVEKPGGHSSMPDKETSIDILANALVRLQQAPFESRLAESTIGFMEHLGPEMPFTNKLVFANPWLFKGVIAGIYEKSPSGNAFVRTTFVPTIFKAGVKDNVIPTVARVTVNFRLLPGDGSQFVIDRVKEIIQDDRIKIEVASGFVSEASEVTPTNSVAYATVNQAVRLTFPETITSPFLLVGGTDSRYFGEVSKGIIKFSPMIDPVGFHGIDERVSLQSFRSAIWFYEKLLKNMK
jgi:carboxypeptidase PM20D1